METAFAPHKLTASSVPGHLVALHGPDSALWRWVCLRGAGFPADGALQLGASEELLRAADEVLAAEQAARAACNNALQDVMASLDALRQNNQWDDKPRRKALIKLRDKLRVNELPPPSPVLGPAPAIEEFARCSHEINVAGKVFEEKFARFVQETSELLRKTAAGPLFREAVTWQNRGVVNRAFDVLLRKSDDEARNSRQRQHEELIASYLQRYCTKNDSIGFFGPIGWARFVDEQEALALRPGKKVLTARKVYFENWPIEAIAAVIARDRAVYPWLFPITMPFIRVDGSNLAHPVYGSMRISPQHAAILQACDGRMSARQVARKLLRLMPGQFKNEMDVYSAMTELAGKRVLYWDFNIPFNARPEQALRSILDRVEDPALRKRGMALLEELEAGRANVEKAAGDPEELNKALEALEQTFTRLTGLSATRAQGQTYAGRTLVYEDCRRDAEVLLGREFLEALEAPLSLLLMSARWLTSELAKLFQTKLDEIYEEMVRATGNAAVDAAVFWLKTMPYLTGEDCSLVEPLQQQFENLWEGILNLSPDPSPVRYSSSELHDRVRSAFPSLSSGWKAGRYHCPDVMICASSEEAIRRGDYLLVLGELHLGGNTLTASLFVNQHPSPEELIRAVEHDLGTPNIVPVAPRGADKVARTNPSLFSRADYRLEYALDSFTTDRSRALPVSSLVIERNRGKLIARTRDGKVHFDVLDLIGGRFSDMVMNAFRLLAPRKHSPRISIDRLVVKRESWRFTPEELSFTGEQHAAIRFLRAREWARANNIPRFVFFKVPVERKPAYLDFNSYIYVDIFSKMVRRTMEASLHDPFIEISEMLPGVDQCWLKDAEGNRYASELRMVAVDLSRPTEA